jgi:hypothetical protein
MAKHLLGGASQPSGPTPKRAIIAHVETAEPSKEHTRKKIRVRVERSSRWWKWKVLLVVALFVLGIGACITVVPHLLSSLISEGGDSQPAADSSPHP